MTMASWTIYLILAVIAFIAYKFFGTDKKNLPKGPRGWPLLGNSLEFQPSVHKALVKWPQEFGDICTIYMGQDRSILLSDPKLVREAFNEPAFSGRPDGEMFTLLSGGQYGVTSNEGQDWAEQRRFTLRHLRDFGFGKTTGEELITNELREFIQGLTKQVGTTVSMNKTFGVPVLNTLWMILSGVRYEQDDPRLWAVLKQSEELVKKLSKNPVLVFLPSIAAKFPRITGFQAFKGLMQKFRDISMEHINRHRSDMNYDDNPRDFIDAYLQEIKATNDPASSFYGNTGIKSLSAVVNDLFAAGADTTSSTLSWLILYLAKFPKTQAKLQAELDEVVGKSRAPALADRSKLPFAEAFITEVMRLSSITPFGLFHRATKDVMFHGYDIPKGSFVLANLYYIHNNPKIWGNPLDFEPERFLSADGKTFKKHDAWMPFSVGKRQCLGETLARDTVFLYFANISHRFLIQLAEESQDVKLEPSLTGTPSDFKVIICERL